MKLLLMDNDLLAYGRLIGAVGCSILVATIIVTMRRFPMNVDVWRESMFALLFLSQGTSLAVAFYLKLVSLNPMFALFMFINGTLLLSVALISVALYLSRRSADKKAGNLKALDELGYKMETRHDA